MTHAEKGAKGGVASAETRLLKGREAVLTCKTKRELLETVQQLEQAAYARGYSACEGKWLRRQAPRPVSILAEHAPQWEGM